MPRRRRVAKRRHGALNPLERVNFTSHFREDLIEAFGSLEDAREVWEDERDRLPRDPIGTRCEAWWEFEGPEHLRAPDSRNVARDVEGMRQDERAWAVLETVRFVWLFEHGELEADELLDLAAEQSERGEIVRQWAASQEGATKTEGGTR